MSNETKTTNEVQNQNDQNMLKFWQGTGDEFGQSVTQNWYNWRNDQNELGEWIETSVPSNEYYQGIAYGDGKFVAISRYRSNDYVAKYIYSEDGINWIDGSNLNSSTWISLKYLNDRFIAIAGNTDKLGYSEDGINWNYSSIVSQYWVDSVYGNGKYIVIGYKYSSFGFVNSTKIYIYSEDGINWTQGTLPTDLTLNHIEYGNGKFIATERGKDETYTANYIYSEDGINWTQGTLPTTFKLPQIRYGNGKFIIYELESLNYIYSEDGINWTSHTLSLDGVNGMRGMIFGNDVFIAYDKTNGKYIYSEDGINWMVKDFSLSKNKYFNLCYGNGKYVAIDNSIDPTNIAYLPIPSSKLVYTKDEILTTDSKVYSNPDVESNLTITSLTESSITLSDNNTYDRNTNGDEQTSSGSIGDDHPDYLCFIDEVGIKIGNKLIIKNNKKVINNRKDDPSKLKFGDRIDNKATVVGTFESSDLGTVVFAVLDSIYYTNSSWVVDNNWYTDVKETYTGLPQYSTNNSDEVLNAKESATYNVIHVLNHYENKSKVTTDVFTYCRNIESLIFNNMKYDCQLPNAKELQMIYNNRKELQSFDSSISGDSQYNISDWKFGDSNGCWSSNVGIDSSSKLEYPWELDNSNKWYTDSSDQKYGVIPIIEIPIQK